MAEKTLRVMRMEVKEKGLKIKVIASCSCLEGKLQECSKRKDACLTKSVETLGVGLRTTAEQLGAKEKARR